MYDFVSFIFFPQAIFMIPTKPPPVLRNPEHWSPDFVTFLSKTLVKTAEERYTAAALLQMPFITTAKNSEAVIMRIVDDSVALRAQKLADPDENSEVCEGCWF
jgi:serine/threonine protein kinase